MPVFLIAAALAADVALPIHGELLDPSGAPIDGAHPLTFRLYADADATDLATSAEVTAGFHDGAFATAISVDSALLATGAPRWLTVQIGTGAESSPVSLGTAPFAAFAWHADDARTVGGLTAEEIRPALGDGLALDGAGAIALDPTTRASIDDASAGLADLTTTTGALSGDLSDLGADLSGLGSDVATLSATVDALSTGGLRFAGARVTAAGVATAVGTGLSSVTRVGPGLYDVNWTPGRFASAPLTTVTSSEPGKVAIIDAATRGDATGARVRIQSLDEPNRHVVQISNEIGTTARTWTRAQLIAADYLQETTPIVNQVVVTGPDGSNLQISFIPGVFTRAPIAQVWATHPTNVAHYSSDWQGLTKDGVSVQIFDDVINSGTNQPYGGRIVMLRLTATGADYAAARPVDGAFQISAISP